MRETHQEAFDDDSLAAFHAPYEPTTDILAVGVSDVVDVSPDPRNSSVAAVDVVFSEPIDLATFTYADLTLTRDGTPVTLSGTVMTTLLSGSTYRISGLEPFTSAGGEYQLTVDTTSVEDLSGSPCVGVESDSWTMVLSVASLDPHGMFPGEQFPTGGYTRATAAADLNGDGYLDIVAVMTTTFGTDHVSVLLGDGDGAFGAPTTYAVGDRPYAVALDDLNGDGHVDIVAANTDDDNVSVLLGTGDGTFAAQTAYAAGDGACSVALGDLNGDGQVDIVTANAAANSVSVLLGGGDGTFALPTTFAAGNDPLSVALADLNGDDHVDVVTSNYSGNNVSVLLGNGDGSFAAQVTYATGSRPGSVALADLNHDGFTDVVTASYLSDNVSVLLGMGDGTFAARTTFEAGDGAREVALADLNHDGHVDVVTASTINDDVSILLGAGDGTFSLHAEYATGYTLKSVVLADFNGDNHVDIITSNYNTYSDIVLLGVGDGTFEAQTTYATGNGPCSVATADLNHDGHVDFVTANFLSDSITVRLGSADGTFTSGNGNAMGDGPNSVALADLNHDGHTDVVTANRNSYDVSIRLGIGDGTFGGETTFSARHQPFSVATADLNHDGHVDIVTASSNAQRYPVVVSLGNGDGTFYPQIMPSVWEDPLQVALADLDHDGHVDIVLATKGDDNVSVLFGSGSGTFSFPTEYRGTSSATSVALADLNHDGHVDIVTANEWGHSVSVLLGIGNRQFAAQVEYAVGDRPWFVTLADMNLDGHVDIIATIQSSRNVTVILGDGDGTFSAQASYATISTPYSAAVDDFNHDGLVDIVATNYGDYTVSVFLQRPGAVVPPTATLTLPIDGAFYNQAGWTDSITGTTSDSTGATVAKVELSIRQGTGNYWDGDGFDSPDEVLLLATGTASWSLAFPDGNFPAEGQYAVRLHVTDTVGNVRILSPATFTYDTTPPTVIDVANMIRDTGDGSTASLDIVFSEPIDPDTFTWADLTLTRDDVPVPLTDAVTVTLLLETRYRISGLEPFTALPGDYRLTLDAAAVADFAENAGVGTGSGDWSTPLSVLLLDANGLFAAQAVYPVRQDPSSVALADLNGDDRLDIVAADQGSDTVSVLLNVGNGAFAAKVDYATQDAPSSIALADLNHDGHLDIVATSDSGRNVSVLLGSGDGTFAAYTSHEAGLGLRSVALADLNHDTHVDIVTASQSMYEISVQLGAGDGTFADQTTYNAEGLPVGVALADLNHDGHVDIVSANRHSDSISVLLGLGDGAFAAQVPYSVGEEPVFVALADLNGDGHVDVVTTNQVSDTVSIMLGIGDGTFPHEATYATGDYPKSAALADLNGDGHIDITTANQNSDDLLILLGAGDGTFAAQAAYAVGNGPYAVAVDDLNQDGYADVVAANYFDDNVSVLLHLADSSSPTGVDLLPSSDTGSSSTDDLTRFDNSTAAGTLQFEVSGTIPGATVTIYANGTPIGSAVAGGTTTMVITDGNHDLVDGIRYITGRQTEPGKQASAHSPPLPVTVDTAAPTADVIDVTPDPRTTPVNSVGIDFSEAVSGFDLAALTLGRNGGANLLTASQTLSSADNVAWLLENLSGLTGTVGNYVLQLTAAGSGIVDAAGNSLTENASDVWRSDSSIVARRVFYNNSSFDGNDPAANASDDAAIATDKEALLPGQTAAFANYTSYDKGINGIMIDVADLPGTPATLDPSNFVFRVGNDNMPDNWDAAPAPTSITVRENEGVDGSDRVTIIWADGSIKQAWVQVTMLAGGATGLAGDDVCYVGCSIGENTGDFKVDYDDAFDNIWPQLFTPNPIGVDHTADVTRDGRIDYDDVFVGVWPNLFAPSPLKQITVPATPPLLESTDFLLDENHPWAIELMWFDVLYGTSNDSEEDEDDALEAATVDGVFSLYDGE